MIWKSTFQPMKKAKYEFARLFGFEPPVKERRTPPARLNLLSRRWICANRPHNA